jgi:WD40 repeat protein
VGTVNRFAFSGSGYVLALFDGNELLVYSDGDPRWRKDLAAEPIGLAATADVVVTLEAGGKISWWRVRDGELIGSADTGENALALVSARSAAVCAAVLPGGVEIAELSKDLRSIPFRGPVTAAALSDDGARIAVGSEDGEVAIVTRRGEPIGTSKLDAAVSSLCWTPAGFWIATAGDRVMRVNAKGGPAERITRAGGMAPDCACASADGALFAIRVKPDMMMSYGYPPDQQVVQLHYYEREIAGVSFGHGRLLGVGLLGGDGNIVDIPAGQLLRTETFSGRKHNSWLVGVNIQPGNAPKAAPSAPAAEPEPPAEDPPAEDPPAVDPPPKPFPVAWLLAVIVAIVALLMAVTR